MPHYRTIRDAAAHYRELDPGTAITENYIRRLVVTGAVPATKSGKKYLVSLEALDDYFQNPVPQPETAPKARRVWQIQ